MRTDGTPNVLIKNNHFDNVSKYSLIVSSSDPATGDLSRFGYADIINNEFSNATGYAIYLFYGYGGKITGNTFTDIQTTASTDGINFAGVHNYGARAARLTYRIANCYAKPITARRVTDRK